MFFVFFFFSRGNCYKYFFKNDIQLWSFHISGKLNFARLRDDTFRGITKYVFKLLFQIEKT